MKMVPRTDRTLKQKRVMRKLCMLHRPAPLERNPGLYFSNRKSVLKTRLHQSNDLVYKPGGSFERRKYERRMVL